MDLAKVLGAHYSSDVESTQSQDLETSSSCPFEFPRSPKPSPTMGTGSLPLRRPSKRSLSPCQVKTLSMLPIKCTCQCFSPPLPPNSTLKPMTSTRASDSKQPIKTTFASLSVPCSTASESFTSPGIRNQGTCHHPAFEYPYSHVCDSSGCGEAHRRPDHLKSKRESGAQ